MNFLAPMAFAFAAVIPVVVVFYLLKRKRVVRVVPSTLLWQKFLAETQASAPFQRLRHNWLLVLQILLLILAILALARPYFSGKNPGGRLEVVILDVSASMQSRDESPSRFEKSRAEALRLVESLRDNDQMVILQAGAITEVKQSPTSEKASLRRAIQSITPSDTPTRLHEAIKLAETLIQNRPSAEIHLFSDGAVPALADFENRGLPINYHGVGQRGNNLGITTLEVRPNPENPAERAVFTSIVNFSTNTLQTEVEFRFDDQILQVKNLKLGPSESAPQVFIAQQDRDGVFSIRLAAEDDLLIDNQASIVSLLPQPVKVLLVTPGNRFLEKAIRAVPSVNLTIAPAFTPPPPETKFDIVVLDNVSPAAWPSGNILAFKSAAPSWFELGQPLENPAIVDWKTSHPLLRFVSFDNVQISESLSAKTPNWAVSLLDSPQSPLLMAGELDQQRIVWIGFDSLQSTWPLRISFPIFVANAMEWLNPAALNSSQLSVQAGQPFRMALSEPLHSAEIRLPDGTVKARPLDPSKGELFFGETLKQGIYQVKAGTNSFVFCVNLLDAPESNTTPKKELQFGKYVQVAATPLRRANMELWRWIVLAALGVLLFEWWYYHRRTA